MPDAKKKASLEGGDKKRSQDVHRRSWMDRWAAVSTRDQSRLWTFIFSMLTIGARRKTKYVRARS